MDDTLCISLVIDDYQDERFKIHNIKDIEKICNFLVKKYHIELQFTKKLEKVIKEYVAKIRNKKYMLTIHEKELVERLYKKEILKKKEKNEKIEKIKENQKEEEIKSLSFSPRISVNPSSYNRKVNTLSGDFDNSYEKYNKNKLIQENIEIQRIRRKNNEINQCKQFISFNEIRQKTIKKPQKLKFPNNILVRETINDIFFKGEKIRHSIFGFSNDFDSRLNLTDGKKFCYTGDINNSNFSFKSITKANSYKTPHKKFRESGRLSRINFDNLFEIKENENVDSELKNVGDDLVIESNKEISKICKSENQKTLTDNSTFSSRKSINFYDENNSKVEKYKKRLKEIDHCMPKAFKTIIKNGKENQNKKEEKIKQIIKSECSFSPKINKKSEEMIKKKLKLNNPELDRQTFAPRVNQTNSICLTLKYIPTKSTKSGMIKTVSTLSNLETKESKKSNIKLNKNKKTNEGSFLEECEERLKNVQKEILFNIFEKLNLSKNPLDEIDSNKIDIEPEFKEKIIKPVLHAMINKNLEFNFHNFYLLSTELLLYVKISSQ